MENETSGQTVGVLRRVGAGSVGSGGRASAWVGAGRARVVG